jgi:hypothetical protein
MPKMHAGHLDVYGIVTVGADVSASKYSLPRSFGGTGDTMISVNGEVVFANPAPYIDIRQVSGGSDLWNDVQTIKESTTSVTQSDIDIRQISGGSILWDDVQILKGSSNTNNVSTSGGVENFSDLLDTPKPASSIDDHAGEIIIVNPNALNNIQKVSYSGSKISDLYSVSGGNVYGGINVNGDANITGVLTLAPANGITNSNGNNGSESFGKYAMPTNSGVSNTAIGFYSLNTNLIGEYNTAVGANTLVSNNNGSFNVAVGAAALTSTVDGNNNTAIGFEAGANLINGSGNVFIGRQAGVYYNTLSNALIINNNESYIW